MIRRRTPKVPPTREQRPGDVAFRQKLKALVLDHGLEQKVIAGALGVSPSAISMALNGKCQVPPAWIPTLASLLRIEATLLTSGWTPRRGGCEKGEERPGPGRRRPRKSPAKAEADRLLRDRLLELMALHQRSRQEVADYLRVSITFLGQILGARAPLPRAWVPQLSQLFQLSPPEFVRDIAWQDGLPGRRRKRTR
jgi:transcriptional regulator with XRE-family HTH domain